MIKWLLIWQQESTEQTGKNYVRNKPETYETIVKKLSGKVCFPAFFRRRREEDE